MRKNVRFIVGKRVLEMRRAAVGRAERLVSHGVWRRDGIQEGTVRAVDSRMAPVRWRVFTALGRSPLSLSPVPDEQPEQ